MMARKLREVTAMARKYVNDADGKFKVALKDDGGKTIAHLLWGDPVQVIQEQAKKTNVKGRGLTGWVPSDALTDEGLLELYIIDVGQGDGVLMRTPDDKWHMIDAGIENEEQMTKKGAANFVRWKFIDDLGEAGVRLENVIVSHSDFDHYGHGFQLDHQQRRPDGHRQRRRHGRRPP